MPWPGPVGGAFAPSSRSAAHRSGVWRELPRISNAKKHADMVGPPKPVLQDPRFEAARFAADNGIFRCYPHAMGGALATRADPPSSWPTLSRSRPTAMANA